MKKRRYRPSKKEEEEDLPRYPIYQMENTSNIENLNGHGIEKNDKDFPEVFLWRNGNIQMEGHDQ